MPHGLAPWDVAYRWFRNWTADGAWAQVHDMLHGPVREAVREADGRDPQPSAAVPDRAGAKPVLTDPHTLFPRIGPVRVDGGHVNSVNAKPVDRAAQNEQIDLVLVPRDTDLRGFRVLPRRWVAEQSVG